MTSTLAGSTDHWIALLSGRRAWTDGERRPSTVTRLAAAGAVAAVVTGVLVALTYRLSRDPPQSTLSEIAPVVMVISGLWLVAAPFRLAVFGHNRPASVVASAVTRGAMFLAFIVGVFATAPQWAALLSWPIGIGLGADAATTSWALGWELSPLRWWEQFLRSAVHLGVIGGLLGAVAGRGVDAVTDAALPVYLTLQLWVLTACAAAWWLGRMYHHESAALAAALAAAAADEHRAIAHWLHDDFCADLRLVSLKVQRGTVALPDVQRMLDDLDFQLRLRQLEELYESGTVRIAEILQPYLRRAQNHGAAIDGVPSFDQASLVVSSDVGRKFGMVAAILTSNALNAGATRVSFEVRHLPGAIALAVVDDAGGFDVAESPTGRGLWSLRDEFGRDAIDVRSFGGGSRVEVTVPLGTASGR